MIRGVLDELKQRSVVRVAGLYAVAGWAVFQVINTLFPALDLPRWTVSAAALLFLAGFPVAIVLAWMFEMTPDGIRLAPRDRRRFGSGQFGWIDWVIAAVVVAVFAFSAVQLINLRQEATGSRPLFASTPSRSVAVLPFASFSSVQADGFFADGLTEELINSLAQSPQLKVAGRTSSFYFKGRNEDLREVGRKLGVAHVVEGSVRRAGARLRVTAQLINVEDGFHLWSQTYDRDVNDALAIQTEVAETVADKLKAHLVGSEESSQTRDPADHRLALIAQARLRTQELDDLRAARMLYAQLRERNPEDALFHAGYAQATILLAQNYFAIPFDQARREANAAIARAIEADPESSDAWRARGAFERVLSIRTGEGSHHLLALAAFRKAYELDPRNPDTMTLLGKQLVTEGQPGQAALLLRQALATDPLSRTAQEVLADALAAEGKYDEARDVLKTLLSLYPDYSSAASAYAEMLIFKQGRLDEVAHLLDNPAYISDDPLNVVLLANAMANMGVPGGVDHAIGHVKPDSPARPLMQAVAMQLAGRRAELLTFATVTGKRTDDPIWGSLQVVESALMGEYNAARAELPANFKMLLQEPPDISGYRELDAIISTWVLGKTGSGDQSRLILEKVLQRLDSQQPAPDILAMKGMALAASGRKGDALATFERAAQTGWRTLIDFDYFVPVADYPFMAEVAADPRFKKVVAAIQADNRRMRDNFLRSRSSEATHTR